MRPVLKTLILLVMIAINNVNAQQLDLSIVKTFEHQLDDVMEVIDTTYLKAKLNEVESQFQGEPSEINKARLGIIYHETALNLSFISKTGYKGYAKKSFDQLSELFSPSTTTKELLPFISSYRASALSLVGAETRKLGFVGDAFALFEDAISRYADVSYLPEFLRGSVAENLPWMFYKKKRFAKLDMESIIDRQSKNSEYANSKVMSFVYWAWANQHQNKKYRSQAILLLDKAIDLDPEYKAGRQRAEQLKSKILKD